MDIFLKKAPVQLHRRVANAVWYQRLCFFLALICLADTALAAGGSAQEAGSAAALAAQAAGVASAAAAALAAGQVAQSLQRGVSPLGVARGAVTPEQLSEQLAASYLRSGSADDPSSEWQTPPRATVPNSSSEGTPVTSRKVSCQFCQCEIDERYLGQHQNRNAACLTNQVALFRKQQQAQTETGAVGTSRKRARSGPGFEETAREDVDFGGQTWDPIQDPIELSSPEFVRRVNVLRKAVSPLENAEALDVDSKFSEWATNANGFKGLSAADFDSLVALLHHPEFDPRKLSFRNHQDWKAYWKELNPDDGWSSQVVSEPDDPCTLVFFLRDPVRLLVELFEAAENADGFALRPVLLYNDQAQRIYSTPQSADWWHSMQDHINKQCADAVIAAMILYSDATTLSNDRRTSGWPLVLSLANISFENRSKKPSHGLMALFPIVHALPGHQGMTSTQV
ncbi:hypothetical protein KFL_003470130 [Klebsormidium nitens]|uniref:Uncharacterized protein n=1 Tax=Klebsormidium nitens TaxID=105231 RepID=A0A1Y1IF18_KLENI|nr:hypothetical protein KFL_003470130 [Klebsormidium nitens]|eukprot:GAQ87356.1 hypothetical protein KFL_003470130 [Klebsormidium nitens]